MNQPHATSAPYPITVIHGVPATAPQPLPQAATAAWADPAASARMRMACAIDTLFEPGDDEGEGGPSGLEMWMPLSRSSDSLNLLGESGVILVGVNELGWVVYDWVPGP